MSWKDFIVPPAFHRKATEVHRQLVKMMGVEPQWSPRNYEIFAKEGYNANVWAFRCVKSIAEGAAGVPWILYRENANGKREEIAKHEVLDLINKPNEMWSRAELIETFVAYALIAGNSYLDMVTPTGGDTGEPKQLWVYRPDRMSIIPHKTDFIGGYEYGVGAEKTTLSAKRISHMRYFNPIDDLYGLSPIEVAGRGIDNDNAANAWNNGLLNNGARPGGAWVTEEQMSQPQYERMKEEMDKTHRGAKNAGKPMLLEGGMKWQEMALSPRDMDFIQAKKMSILEICAAFSVPPEIVGYGEQKTYSNYQEARKALYTDAILPMLNKVRDKFNLDLAPRYGENLFLDYDTTAIEPLKENRDSIYKRAGEAYKSELITKNEARFEIGYGEIEGGDEFYKPPKTVAPGAAPPEDDEEEEGKKSHFFNVKALNMDSEEQKTLFWKNMEKGRGRYYGRAEKAVQKEFEAERKAVIKAFLNGGEAAAMAVIEENQKKWQRLFAGMWVEIMRDFGNALMDQFKKDLAGDLETKAPMIPAGLAFEVFNQAVQRFISAIVAQKVVGITDVTMNKIKKRIAAGEKLGESLDQIAKRIDGLYLDEIIPNRSMVIARTEVIGASNAGNSYAADQTGLKLEKEWLTTRDGRQRDSHDKINGEKKPKEDRYSNGLMFPGDPIGEAEEVIQCRCTEIYSVVK